MQATANRRASHRSKSNRAAKCLLLKRHLATSDWISLLFSHPFVCQRGLEKKAMPTCSTARKERLRSTGTVNSSFINELRGFEIMITAYEKSRTNCVVGSSPEVVALRSKMGGGCAIGFNILSKQRAKRKRKRYYYLQPQKITPGKTP